jgi:4-carboxymuconolactone decarboxylase
VTVPTRDGPRIPPVRNPDPEVAATLAKTLADPHGYPLNIFATLAHHPRLLKRFNVLAGLFLAHGELAPREREMAVLRTAWKTGSEYEWGQHTAIGARAGVTESEMLAMTQPVDPDVWSERDACLLRFTDELLDRVDVSEETWSAAQRHWSEAELIELTMLVGFYRMVAGFLTTVRVQREADIPGWPSGRRTSTDTAD